MSTEPLIRQPGTSVGFARPMFEVLPDAADLEFSADCAKWPEPWAFWDLDGEVV